MMGMACRSSVVSTSFADLAGGHRFQRLGIDDLDHEAVLPDVEAILVLALEGDAGPIHLGETIGVEGLHPEQLLDPLPGLLGMGLGPDHEQLQVRVRHGIDAEFLEHVVEAGQIARNGMDNVRTEILHELDLAPAVACGGWDREHSQALGPVLEAKPAGEQAIAADVLEHVLRTSAGGVQRPGDEVRPGSQVVARMEDHGRVAGRAAGAMQANELVPGHGQKAVGVAAAQVLFVGEGQVPDLGDVRQILGADSGLLERGTVIRRLRGLFQRGLKPFQLESFQLLARQQFELGLPTHGYNRLRGLVLVGLRKGATAQ